MGQTGAKRETNHHLWSGSMTGGINFELAPGGAISSRVTGQAGSPLAARAVDLVRGWYDTCADTNGYYTIDSVALGTYDGVAGHDFCGPHSYVGQTIPDVALTVAVPNMDGIDFALVFSNLGRKNWLVRKGKNGSNKTG